MSNQVKPGDLAVIVGGLTKENHGRVVKVMCELPPTPPNGTIEGYVDVKGRPAVFRNASGATLLFDVAPLGSPLFSTTGLRFTVRPYSARFLRPLRDTDGEDEVLRIAGLPKTDFTDTTFMPLEKSK